VSGLDKRLLAERDTIRAVLGKNWRQAGRADHLTRALKPQMSGHADLDLLRKRILLST
jgi:hypothetical protein